MNFKEYISDDNYNRFSEFNDDLLEIFDSDIKNIITITDNSWDFHQQFKINENIYDFVCKLYNNSANIGFMCNGSFNLTNSNIFNGTIFSGIFKCLTNLLSEFKLTEFSFGTNNDKLINLYDNKNFQNKIWQKFRYKLIDKKKKRYFYSLKL